MGMTGGGGFIERLIKLGMGVPSRGFMRLRLGSVLGEVEKRVPKGYRCYFLVASFAPAGFSLVESGDVDC